MTVEAGVRQVKEVPRFSRIAAPTHYLIDIGRRFTQPTFNFIDSEAKAHPGIPVIITIALVVLSPLIYDLANKL